MKEFKYIVEFVLVYSVLFFLIMEVHHTVCVV